MYSACHAIFCWDPKRWGRPQLNVLPNGADFRPRALTAKVTETNLPEPDCCARADAMGAIYACQEGLRTLAHAEQALTPKSTSAQLSDRTVNECILLLSPSRLCVLYDTVNLHYFWMLSWSEAGQNCGRVIAYLPGVRYETSPGRDSGGEGFVLFKWLRFVEKVRALNTLSSL